ncbi:small ribosomal subunit Rsm22 family protein [Chelatococcus sp. SYSU_G07232]|uniref:Small ribosomal subunit Rsm22 family protein n=1 Tax=Chelatococcus albus TaxID=3047466 RepID=A0ABT7AH19_9HYPH|nr:small ribosomal subunit Rsm22 family protein [Chelatococcus sp. SYSU_G07232]MDJ1158676.1 small ribosomal subunit Rsm22 family protein [Chelatococcus sp. SYSU_G07232]
MELPVALRQAVDRALDGVPVAELARAAERLSRRYRAELRDGRFHIDDDLAARAYLATRLPATFAAIRASLDAVAAARPDFAPHSLLDVGSGPGSALWATAACWPGIDDALLVEGSPAIRAWGEKLAAAATPSRIAWQEADIAADLPELAPRDLVTLAYVLDELAPEARGRLVDALWSRTAGVFVIVEPGTPAGSARMLALRDRLIAAGAHLIAPCPHAAACPLPEQDWCHFSRRVARSRLHRLAKAAEVPWEDEKFAYVAVSRRPPSAPPSQARILAPPRSGSGRIDLKLCTQDGRIEERRLTRREGEVFRTARRLGWGDALA